MHPVTTASLRAATEWEDRLLLEATRSPWSSAQALACRLGLSVLQTQGLCDALREQKYLCVAEHLDPLTYAPTPEGLLVASRSLQTDVKWLCRWAHLTAERYWALRAAPHGVRNLERFAISLIFRQQELEPGCQVDWEFFIPRRNHTLMLPARFVIQDATRGRVRPFYLWLDHDSAGSGSDTLQTIEMRRLFRYLAQDRKWQPVWLILARDSQRLESLVWAARRARFPAPLFCSNDFEMALTQDPQLARWRTLRLESWGTPKWEEQSPFDEGGLEPVSARAFAATRHALPNTQEWTHAPKKTARATLVLAPPSDWPTASLLATFEQLTETQRQVLVCLSRCPGMSVVALTGATDLSRTHVLDAIQVLGDQHFIERQGDVCFAMPLALKVMALRESCDMKRSLALYAFHKQDRLRRPGHTELGFAFFTRLKEDAARVSVHRARLQKHHYAPRPVVTVAEVRDEMACRAWVSYAVTRYWQREWETCEWRPDGYGLLDVGGIETPFFLEIGGTAAAPSKLDPEKWATKVEALFRYAESGQWQANYPEFPRWLIVLSVPLGSAAWHRRVELIHELIRTQRSPFRRDDGVQVFATPRATWEKHGALMPIWTNLVHGIFDEPGHAFEGIGALGVELDL